MHVIMFSSHPASSSASLFIHFDPFWIILDHFCDGLRLLRRFAVSLLGAAFAGAGHAIETAPSLEMVTPGHLELFSCISRAVEDTEQLRKACEVRHFSTAGLTLGGFEGTSR